MPIYITQGRYTREAIKGMIVKPEDRYESLSRHVARTGGRVLSYYMTFGEYDFLTVIEAPGEMQMAAVLLSAAASGGVSDLRTCLAMTRPRSESPSASASTRRSWANGNNSSRWHRNSNSASESFDAGVNASRPTTSSSPKRQGQIHF